MSPKTGDVPKGYVQMFEKKLNEYDKKVGWFWFKGKKIPIGADVSTFRIPYVANIYEEDE